MGLVVRNVRFDGFFKGTFPQVPPPPPAPSDQYAQYTVLQLPGTGTNNTNNNTFVDSSANNFAITRFGNTTQGSFSPFSTAAGYWSNYFDGSDDALRLASNAAFGFGTGDFTVELWIYPIVNAILGGSTTLFDFRTGLTGTPWTIFLKNTGSGNYIGAYTSYGGTGVEAQGTILPLNSWYHVALQRTSGTWAIYINGVSQTLTGSSYNGNLGSNNQVTIGLAANLSSSPYAGYMSNIRIVKGTALYTTNFTPSTTPLTAISGTSLLTCQSNRFIDNSSNNFALTVNGDTSVSAFGPFAATSAYNASTMGGSMYFDGSGNYLSVPDNAVLELGSNNFTVEAWIYPTLLTGVRIVLAKWLPSQYPFLFYTNNTELKLGINNSLYFGSAAGVIKLNQWQHVAATRNGNNWYLFVDGVQVATTTNSISVNNDSNNWCVGINPDTLVWPWTGYISNLRMVNGTALYTTNFTPPTAPVSAVSGTSLLLNGTNAAIYDATVKTNVETLGDAKVSTTISANGSMYFDGSGDYLTMPSSPNYVFGTGDFTIEGWIHTSNAAGTQVIYDQRNPNSQNTGFDIFIQSSVLKATTINNVFIFGAITIASNTWTHFAITRSGTTVRSFINGVLDQTANGISWNMTNSSVKIGSGLNGTFTGYMNDFRVTKGIARYTSNFTPPTRS